MIQLRMQCIITNYKIVLAILVAIVIYFNVNVHLLTFNLVQREQEVKSIVTALEVDRHGPLYTMGSGFFH